MYEQYSDLEKASDAGLWFEAGFTKNELLLLEYYFQRNNFPDQFEIEFTSIGVNLPVDIIRKWFRHRLLREILDHFHEYYD